MKRKNIDRAKQIDKNLDAIDRFFSQKADAIDDSPKVFRMHLQLRFAPTPQSNTHIDDDLFGDMGMNKFESVELVNHLKVPIRAMAEGFIRKWREQLEEELKGLD